MHEYDVLRFWHGLRGGDALDKRTCRSRSHHADKGSTVHQIPPVEIHRWSNRLQYYRLAAGEKSIARAS